MFRGTPTRRSPTRRFRRIADDHIRKPIAARAIGPGCGLGFRLLQPRIFGYEEYEDRDIFVLDSSARNLHLSARHQDRVDARTNLPSRARWCPERG
jgi:hypothetical protein